MQRPVQLQAPSRVLLADAGMPSPKTAGRYMSFSSNTRMFPNANRVESHRRVRTALGIAHPRARPSSFRATRGLETVAADEFTGVLQGFVDWCKFPPCSFCSDASDRPCMRPGVMREQGRTPGQFTRRCTKHCNQQSVSLDVKEYRDIAKDMISCTMKIIEKADQRHVVWRSTTNPKSGGESICSVTNNVLALRSHVARSSVEDITKWWFETEKKVR